jgi:transposase-like protein
LLNLYINLNFSKNVSSALSNIKAEDLKLFLKTQEKKESIGYPEDWQKYIGLVFKGRLYRVVPQENKKYRLDALETFWGYLKRKLSAKGGIRKEKLSLYLGEYAWRYNHRKLPLQEQEKRLLSLISDI